MRNVVVGSFVGFVLAAAFLAACGGGRGGDGGGGGPVPISTPSAEKWSALGSNYIAVTGVDLVPSSVWKGTATYDNSVAGLRDPYASFEVMANVSAATVGVEVGILPAVNGTDYATEPEWLGAMVLTSGSNKRASLSNVRIPPTKFRFALRLSSSVSTTARVLRLSLTPYHTELQ